MDTSQPAEVEEVVLAIYKELFPEGDPSFVRHAFAWAEECFTGKYDGYQAIDARYHDWEHTLQGTLCLARILAGRHRNGAKPRVSRQSFELGLLAILFHDTGYLKRSEDRAGTGAKYTLTHVRRSAEFARGYLGQKGFNEQDLQSVQNMIRCTGISSELAAIRFQSAEEQIVGHALATGDLLGQMAAGDYVDKLPVLFQEFAEAVAFSNEPNCRLARFRDAEDLIVKTPSFFSDIVMPRLERDFGGLYRFLNDPYPDGPNPYLQWIGENLERIESNPDSQTGVR